MNGAFSVQKELATGEKISPGGSGRLNHAGMTLLTLLYSADSNTKPEKNAFGAVDEVFFQFGLDVAPAWNLSAF
ncbi:hypothetical protein PoMZ_00083 [Pyricularia oryzae]|uniref:Uncharacterized protein n=1 Tax=Pyricularia oryzae TaxID=318829 RepID=A0A4P7MYW9_PYROR|nr:hypothetical protein PoMZ_00083 [Pyricularia oryzae]